MNNETLGLETLILMLLNLGCVLFILILVHSITTKILEKDVKK